MAIESLSQPIETEEFSDTDDTDSVFSAAGFDEQNAIFISDLPLNMSEQRLFDTLWDEFINVGQIKVTTRKILQSIF